MASGYIQIRIDDKLHRAHRIAFLYMLGRMPKDQVDHLNHHRDDNRWCNLEESDNVSNHRNMKRNSNNTSGRTGVTWSKQNNKWVAQIKVNYRNINLGLFVNIKDAITAREEAEKKYGFHENHSIELGGVV